MHGETWRSDPATEPDGVKPGSRGGDERTTWAGCVLGMYPNVEIVFAAVVVRSCWVTKKLGKTCVHDDPPMVI